MKEGIIRYIDSKENVLSPSTVREYRKASERDLKILHSVSYRKLTPELIQSAINNEAETHSPKTVRNMYNLLTASLKMFYPEFHANITLPQKIRPTYYVPTDKDIKKLLKNSKGEEIEKAILLAALGSLRRSEISPLTIDDITDIGVVVNKAQVKNSKNEWVIKSTKSYAGNRISPLPPKVLKKMTADKNGKIVNLTPEQIYRYFKKKLTEYGIPDFRFHDLRHYYASVLHFLQVPDKYIMEYGGWNTRDTLDRVYKHILPDKESKEQEKIVNFFDSLSESKQG